MDIKSRNVSILYKQICGELSRAPRVNGTHEINNAKITLTDITDNVISCRNISIAYCLGELLWYFTARNDVNFISKFSSFWSKISDDGVTNNSAYGYVLMKKHGFNQIEKIIELLKYDPNSRRAVLNINEANENVIETKDEPCTICLQFLIRDNKLHCTAIMRSNDIWLGFPYDIVFFTELQKYIASRLMVGYGTYTHFATSLHVYDRDFEKITNLTFDPQKVYINSGQLHACKELIVEELENSLDPKKDIVELARKYGVISEVPYEN